MLDNNKPIIIHVLPQNLEVCGGIKVHYQLSEMEVDLGYESYCAFPKLPTYPSVTWFSHHCKEITYLQAVDMLLNRYGVVIGWENLGELDQFPTHKKIGYIQGASLFDKSQLKNFQGELWYSTDYNRKLVGTEGSLIYPAIDSRVFFYIPHNVKFKNDKFSILVPLRKGGEEKLKILKDLLDDDLKETLEFNLVPDVHEREFSTLLRKSDMVFLHSYPEGLGLVGLEAMASGTLPIGFSGGGGSVYLNEHNSFIVPDGDYNGLVKILKDKLLNNFSYYSMLTLTQNGLETVKLYDGWKTESQLKQALDKYTIKRNSVK